MKSKEFSRIVQNMQDEIGCDGEGRIAAHKIPSKVWAYCPDTDQYFDIVELTPDMLLGCGCWSGFKIILSENKEGE